MIRRIRLLIDHLGDTAHTIRRANRGDFTPEGFRMVEGAEVAREVGKVEITVEALSDEDAAAWRIGEETGLLERAHPYPPIAASVVR